MTSRREFVQRVAAAAAFGAGARGPVFEVPRAWRGVSVADLLPEVDETVMRQYALAAVDAARRAGAEFADVRITAVRELSFTSAFYRDIGSRPGAGEPTLVFPLDYGVRALVNGAWGFAGGYTFDADSVVAVARNAVTRARSNPTSAGSRLELAPTPRVENGVWATPIERDPFAVPLGEQVELFLEALRAGERVRGVMAGMIQVGWKQMLHVFASSEGSSIVQRFSRASHSAWMRGRSQDAHEPTFRMIEGVRDGGFGYESVSRPGFDLVAGARRAAEQAVAASAPPPPPPIPVEVGRYDLVLSPYAVGAVLTQTLVPALNLERALGYQANGAGTSFAAPPSEVLGTYQIASPLITVKANRTRPHAYETVGWDDEGVPAGEHTLVKDGMIADYLTSRQTAAELAPYYRGRGEAVGSRGNMMGRGQEWPEVGQPNLELVPGSAKLSQDDLIAGTKRGFYVSVMTGNSDQQLLSGQFKGIEVREIRAGKLGRGVSDFAFQFITPQFWKKIDAIGGVGSAPREMGSSWWMVPIRVREMNVLSTRITL